MDQYRDILFDVRDGVARITINRPEKYNAFTAHTCEELIDAFRRAGYDKSVAVIVLGGAGDRAFCTGADQSAHEGAYEGRGTIGLPIDELQSLIRDVPKPVIARVQGFAIGGGNVLATLCDLTIASEEAVFGQVGPKVGSVDPGFGTAYLARIVGEKRAREMWYLCHLYDAATAERWGLVNRVVPAAELMTEAKAWAAEIAEKSPTALRFLKQSFNADTDHQAGLSNLAMSALDLYAVSPEGMEGAKAFAEKRKPDFAAHVVHH